MKRHQGRKVKKIVSLVNAQLASNCQLTVPLEKSRLSERMKSKYLAAMYRWSYQLFAPASPLELTDCEYGLGLKLDGWLDGLIAEVAHTATDTVKTLRSSAQALTARPYPNSRLCRADAPPAAMGILCGTLAFANHAAGSELRMKTAQVAAARYQRMKGFQQHWPGGLFTHLWVPGLKLKASAKRKQVTLHEGDPITFYYSQEFQQSIRSFKRSRSSLYNTEMFFFLFSC
eukprot:TRINITY_DN289_c0_g1_i2.p2 TRINITY_DN289_c0_g1~~TRINITY_DN289_c0_g1_i2.p2  ORF type:complete len:230 (+),score=36.32 TRINITY_DN289_c0_g1_i2:1076-1765(+)